MNKLYFCGNFFLIDWRHKRVKNTIDLYTFMDFGKVIYENAEKKKKKLHNKPYLYIRVTDILTFYEVLFSICKGLFFCL